MLCATHALRERRVEFSFTESDARSPEDTEESHHHEAE